MEKEFTQYTEALALKELGFDEECFGYYTELVDFVMRPHLRQQDCIEGKILAPTWQSAFRWFREKQGLIYSIGHIGHTNTWVYEIINMRIAGPDYGYGETYEETELACLKKLIQIVKEKL